MIDFDGNKRFIAFWFVEASKEPLPESEGKLCDWFCASWVDAEGFIEFSYRFHYYEGDPSAGQGNRSWDSMRTRLPADKKMIEKHIRVLTDLARLNVLRNNSRMHIIKCDLCDSKTALELLGAQPCPPSSWTPKVSSLSSRLTAS